MPFPFFKGFRSWLKNPGERGEAAQYFANLHSLQVPDDIPLAEIRRMVDRLFSQVDEDFNFDRLKLVGAKAVPLLIECSGRPKTAVTKFNGHILSARSPFERICKLIVAIGSNDTAKPLAKYLDHDDDHFRKNAAFALGSIGSAECIAPMVKALGDDDDYVRSYAMMGIQRGMESSRCTKEFLKAMIPGLARLLNRRDGSVSGTAPILLLAIDADRTLPSLLSPIHFTIENTEAHYILAALNSSGHKIPHDRLLPFLDATKPLANIYPHSYQYAEALLAYARNPDSRAEQRFLEEMASSEEKVRVAAAEAMAVLAGVVNARNVVFNAEEEYGFDALTQPQKYYFAVSIYDSEVCNGGHAQYFVNSSGDHWKTAIQGLQAINAVKRATILRKAVALFGPNGPSEDNDLRHRQISRFSAKQDTALYECDEKHYSCDEGVDALLAEYTVHHSEDFVGTGRRNEGDT